jgi:hypothetical protein
MLLSMFVLIFVDHGEGNAGVDTPPGAAVAKLRLSQLRIACISRPQG